MKNQEGVCAKPTVCLLPSSKLPSCRPSRERKAEAEAPRLKVLLPTCTGCLRGSHSTSPAQSFGVNGEPPRLTKSNKNTHPAPKKKGLEGRLTKQCPEGRISRTETPGKMSRLSGHRFMQTSYFKVISALMGQRPLHRSPSSTAGLPEAGRSVVQGVVSGLHFVLQDRGALPEGEPQQVIADDHHRDPRRANVLLRTSKNHPKLKTRNTHHCRRTWVIFLKCI